MQRKIRKLRRANNSDGKIQLNHSDKSLITSLDFNVLELPRDVTSVMSVAFRCVYGKRTRNSQLLRFNSLKQFAQFCKESRISNASDLTTEAINRFLIWLRSKKRRDGEPLSISTLSSTYTATKTLLNWIQENHPAVLPQIDFPYSPFPNRNQLSEKKDPLEPEVINTLIKCCERDIQDIWKNFNRAQQILAESSPNFVKGSLEWLLVEINKYYGLIPTQQQLLHDKRSDIIYWMMKHGGKKKLLSYLGPTSHTIFPYYLLILIHTAGNPEAIANLSRDCLRPLPLTDDQESVVWDKGRSAHQQIRSYSARDTFQPPQLIRQVKAMTERLQHKIQSEENLLFLFISYKGQRVAKLGYRNLAKGSISWWCRRHKVPEFSFDQIRTSVLNITYRKYRDIFQVQRMANHTSLRTTKQYISHTENAKENKAYMAHLQGSVEKWLKQESATIVRDIDENINIDNYENATAFGFQCKNPYQGIAPGSKTGSRCPAFTACFTCPNAVLLLDVETLARLLQARNHYLDCECRIHPSRWEELYAPQLDIIEKEILPRFDPELWIEAERFSKTLHPLPELR